MPAVLLPFLNDPRFVLFVLTATLTAATIAWVRQLRRHSARRQSHD